MLGGSSLTPLVPISMHEMKLSANSVQEQTIAPFYTGKERQIVTPTF